MSNFYSARTLYHPISWHALYEQAREPLTEQEIQTHEVVPACELAGRARTLSGGGGSGGGGGGGGMLSRPSSVLEFVRR